MLVALIGVVAIASVDRLGVKVRCIFITAAEAVESAGAGTPTGDCLIAGSDLGGDGGGGAPAPDSGVPLQLTAASLPQSTQGETYSFDFSGLLLGGEGVATWSADLGFTPLPDGFTLDPATGILSGTPINFGQSPLRIIATDASGQTTRDYQLDIRESIGRLTGIAGGRPMGAPHCGITEAAQIACWGTNWSSADYVPFAVSNATVAGSDAPYILPALTGSYSQVVMSRSATCVLETGGTVQCWGDNANGALGNGTTTPSVGPVPVVGLPAGIVAISAGYATHCAVTSSGEVYCWGGGEYGQMGDGASVAINATPRLIPGITDAVDVAVGSTAACAPSGSGAVSCWGYGQYGVLGDGVVASNSWTSGPFHAPRTVIGLENGVAAIDVEEMTACALMSSGQMKCWGFNLSGQLGNGTGGNGSESPTPVDVLGMDDVISMSLGYRKACALESDGAAYCWGINSPALGIDMSTYQSYYPTPSPVLSVGVGSGALEIFSEYATFVRRADGGILAWGQDFLGNGGAPVGSYTAVYILTPSETPMP